MSQDEQVRRGLCYNPGECVTKARGQPAVGAKSKRHPKQVLQNIAHGALDVFVVVQDSDSISENC